MTITMTEKEYNAVAFALDQIGTVVEAATNEEYIKDAEEASISLYSIMEKYKKARFKANEFQQVRAYVASKNRNSGLRAKDIDKLTRLVMKKM